jgi:Heterokaryon incompatibility protein (HET)
VRESKGSSTRACRHSQQREICLRRSMRGARSQEPSTYKSRQRYCFIKSHTILDHLCIIKAKIMNDSNISIYAPLEAKADIRLLLLHPGPTSAPICCTLVHAKVCSKPIYEALSYVWGAAEGGYSINLNNQIHGVRPNLWLALCQLRLPFDLRCMWIDALCINQHDVAERNYQVSRMGQIYSEAKMVHAWLGLSGPYTAAGVEFLIRADMGPKNKPRDDDDKNAMRGIVDIMLRQYWQRLWIIQEFVLANDLMVYCGEFEIPWKLLAVFNGNRAYSKGSICNYGADVIWQRDKFQAARENCTSMQMRKQESLLDAIRFHRDAKCFDTRDKLCACLLPGMQSCRLIGCTSTYLSPAFRTPHR